MLKKFGDYPYLHSIITNLLMDLAYDKHPFLKELGITPENSGAYYNGTWTGNGEVLKSINPATEEVVSTTKGASLEDYENAVKAMWDAKS